MKLFKKSVVPEEIERVPPVEEITPEEKPERSVSSQPEKLAVEIEKLRVEIDTLNEARKVMLERFSRIDERIGELRAMIADLEKSFNEVRISSEKAVEIVNTIQPENILKEAEKNRARLDAFEAKIETVSTIIENFTKDLKEVKEKFHTLKGIEEVIKLNEEVRKEIETIKTIQAQADRDANRVERMFLDVQNKYREFQELSEKFDELRISFSNLVKEFDDIKIKITNLAEKKELVSFEKSVSQKLEWLKQFSPRDFKSVKDFEKEIKDLRNKMEEQSSSLNQKLSNKIDALKKEIKELKKLEGYQKEIFKLKNSLETLRTQLARLRKEKSLKEITKVKERVFSLQKELSVLTSRVDKLAEEKKPEEEMFHELHRCETEIKTQASTLQDLVLRINSLEERMRSLKEEIPKQTEFDIKNLTESIKIINEEFIKLKEKMNSMESRESIYFDEFKEKMNEISKRISKLEEWIEDYSDYTQNTIKRIEDKINILRTEFQRPSIPQPTKEKHNLFTKLVSWKNRKRDEPKTHLLHRSSLTSPGFIEDVEIVKEQIKELRMKNKSEDTIINHLLAAGFDEEVITQAVKELKDHHNKNKKRKTH